MGDSISNNNRGEQHVGIGFEVAEDLIRHWCAWEYLEFQLINAKKNTPSSGARLDIMEIRTTKLAIEVYMWNTGEWRDFTPKDFGWALSDGGLRDTEYEILY